LRPRKPRREAAPVEATHVAPGGSTQHSGDPRRTAGRMPSIEEPTGSPEADRGLCEAELLEDAAEGEGRGRGRRRSPERSQGTQGALSGVVVGVGAVRLTPGRATAKRIDRHEGMGPAASCGLAAGRGREPMPRWTQDRRHIPHPCRKPTPGIMVKRGGGSALSWRSHDGDDSQPAAARQIQWFATPGA